MAHYVIDDCCYDCLSSDTVERLSLASLQRQTLLDYREKFLEDMQIDITLSFFHYSWRWQRLFFL
jgi:hypothetical protein